MTPLKPLLTAILAAGLVGCGSRTTAPAQVGGSPPVAGDAAEIPAAESEDARWYREVASLTVAQRRAALRKAGMEVELAVANLSGLEALLGGPTPTRRALADAWAPIVARVERSPGLVRSVAHAPPGFFEVTFDPSRSPGMLRFADSPPGTDGGSGSASNEFDGAVGMGMFGGLMLTALTAAAPVELSNTMNVGDKPAVDRSNPPMVLTATLESAGMTVEAEHTDPKSGVTTKLKTRSTVHPCPDANGRFKADAMMDISISKGAVGANGTLNVEILGQVDEDAMLIGSDVESRSQWARFGDKPGGFIDFSLGLPSSGSSVVKVNRTGGAVTAELFAQARMLNLLGIVMLKSQLESAAEKGWKSGRCVRLEIKHSAGPKRLEPKTRVTSQVAPRSKVDGSATGGAITANLSGGSVSVEPSGSKVRADATFTYVAPEKKNEYGDVNFESRSRRGVGKETVRFDTRITGYSATYQGRELSLSGKITDLAAPFWLNGKFIGGTAEFAYTPTDDRHGSLSISGGGSGAKVKGGGTYTIRDNSDGTMTLVEKTNACVDVSGACVNETHNVLLTPTES